MMKNTEKTKDCWKKRIYRLWISKFVICLKGLSDRKITLVLFLLSTMNKENKVCLTQRQVADLGGILIQ